MLKDQPTIPSYTLNRLERYVIEGKHPGGFLAALLENDLGRTFASADLSNRPAIFSIYLFVYNYCPADCHGGFEQFVEWLEGDGLKSLFDNDPEPHRLERTAKPFRKRFAEYRAAHYDADEAEVDQ